MRDVTLYIYFGAEYNKNASQIFGVSAGGTKVKSVFDKMADFLDSQYKKERMPLQEKRAKINQFKQNARVLVILWKNIDESASTWRTKTNQMEQFLGNNKELEGKIQRATPPVFADLTAQRNYELNRAFHRSVLINGNLLLQVVNRGDDFTKRILCELLLDSPKKFDMKLTDIVEKMDVVSNMEAIPGDGRIPEKARTITLSRFTEMLLSEDRENVVSLGTFIPADLLRATRPGANIDDTDQQILPGSDFNLK